MSDTRRSLMNYVSADGQVLPNLIFYTEVTAQTDAEQIEIQAVPSDSCIVLVATKSLPPLPSDFTFLAYKTSKVSYSTGQVQQGDILRANGTIGSDTGEGGFNPSTGVVRIGANQYGKLVAGRTYCVYQIEWPEE